ncbi:MAG: hypothetical protein QHH43_06110 [Candidatus Saccharicenans sp.]|jgi:hypothetical protein|nr:hypothetical protein [Candidatus Saccharicenans sp.]MDH7575314.1 hypothetical protein [Candidatus Saccharicenans sp.]
MGKKEGRHRIRLTGSTVFLLVAFLYTLLAGQTPSGTRLPKNLSGLKGPFNLAPGRSPEVQYYLQETRLIQLGFDGLRRSEEVYSLKLKRVPAKLAGQDGDVCSVGEFSLKFGDKKSVTVPGLAGWSYVFRQIVGETDKKGQVFGIPHDRFENLMASDGQKLSTVTGYAVYNSFIDFHGFCDVFAWPAEGGGIQDLKYPGQSVRHAAAFTEPPVNLGQGIKEGSFFRNGEVRLVFKGVGLANGSACAIVGFDSGESTLKMIMPAPQGGEIVTVGGSEYLGDIYLNLKTGWVELILLDEFVVTETQLPPSLGGQKMPAYNVRHLTIRKISREEFEKKLGNPGR